jgi:putative transposase
VEHNGLLVCEGCGLVLAPVYEPPKFKPADSFNGSNGSSISSGGLAQRALEALAGELGVPAGAALEVYKRLRRYAGVGEAAAIALFVSAKRCGSYVSLKRACELLSKCGVKAEYPRALKTMLAYAPLIRPTMEEALEAYAAKLGIGESVKREAAESETGGAAPRCYPAFNAGLLHARPEGRPLQLAPSLGARAARGPVSRNRPDPRKRGWAQMGRAPRKGRGMEVESKKVPQSGSRAAGRSPRANRLRSERKQTETKNKGNKTKNKKKKDENNENGLVPLNAWARLQLEQTGDPCGSGGRWAQAVRVQRVDTLRLLTTPELGDFLWRVGDATAKLINMENFRRRKLFFERKGIDCSWMSAWSRRFADYFEIYKLLGSANFHDACRLISDQWKSFLGLLRAAKEGKLEPWQKVRPPGYRKRDGQRVPIIVVRFDNYRVDLERRVLHLGYWNVDIPFKGKPRWLTKPGAKQGRLIITYDPAKKRWYARASMEVALESKLNHGLKAGIDLGRERLIALVTEPLNESGEGVALLYRGGPLKSDYFYFEKKIAEIDKMLADPKLEEADRSVLKELRRRFYEKGKRHREQIFANSAAHLARMCLKLGVSAVFIGGLRGLAQDKPSKGNSNMWSYRKLKMRLATTFENHGIAVFEIPEDNTSKTCARHGCEVQRGPRGLVWCPFGHTMHADLNAAMNILARGGGRVSTRVRVRSFIPTASRVIPVNGKDKNSNPA